MKYRWTHLDRRGRYFLRSHSYFSFGISLHRVLERFHDSNDQGVTTVEQAVSALEESWLTAGYESQQELDQAWGTGVSIIEGHVRQHLNRVETAKTIAVEQRYTRDMGDFSLVGQIDRLDEHADGRIEIIDYKSLREGTNAEYLRTDVAMNCYQILVRGEYPGREVTSTILSLQTGESCSYTPNEAEIEEFESELRYVASHVANRDWEHVVPVYKSLCPRCEFLPLCRQSPDFIEPESTELAPDPTSPEPFA